MLDGTSSMTSDPLRLGPTRNLLVATAVFACLLAGCAVLGPSAIRNGRLAYNEAITETNNQQLLLSVIHSRYGQRGSLLSVASVTANVRITTSSTIQLGFGSFDDYAGNLVPFSGGAVFEENPTISYTPVEGAKYLTQIFSPIPVPLLAQLAGTLADSTFVYNALVSSVNGIRNPDFLFSPADADPRFGRLTALLTTLARANRLHWVADSRRVGNFSIVIDHSPPAYEGEVHELLGLLGLPAPDGPSARVILPVSLALDGRDSGSIGIITRSVYAMVQILSAAVQIPEADRRDGIAASYPPPGPAGNGLRVHYSPGRPESAAVAVGYRGGWFYIDDRDQNTKQFFRLMSTLWSVAIAESAAKGSAAPVLTVPVSR